MTKQLALAAILAVGLTIGPSTGLYARDCTREHAIEADSSIDTLDSWSSVYAAYRRYGDCDDGAVAEGYSDRIVALLVNDWRTTAKLAKLSRSDPAFERFVLAHIDLLMTPDQAKAIVHSAKTECPNRAVELCQHLIKKASSPD
jgi:hypothetical protein